MEDEIPGEPQLVWCWWHLHRNDWAHFNAASFVEFVGMLALELGDNLRLARCWNHHIRDGTASARVVVLQEAFPAAPVPGSRGLVDPPVSQQRLNPHCIVELRLWPDRR
jgi:hypothetical protein